MLKFCWRQLLPCLPTATFQILNQLLCSLVWSIWQRQEWRNNKTGDYSTITKSFIYSLMMYCVISYKADKDFNIFPRYFKVFFGARMELFYIQNLKFEDTFKTFLNSATRPQ